MKILFLVSTLDCGGAQRQLVVLANELARRGHHVAMAVYYSGGFLEKEVDRSRVNVIHLGKQSRWDLLSFLWNVFRVIWRERPDVLHGWMSTPNLVASIARLLYPRMQVFWCMRSADLELFFNLDRVQTIANWLEGRLSRFAVCIVVNSRAGFSYLVSRGFPQKKIIHIPNGIDINGLYFDPSAGEKVRVEWGFSPAEKLVGLIGRFHPVKNHVAFLKAAAQLVQDLPNVRFVCVGEGPAVYRESLEGLGYELGLGQKVLWVPPRLDVRSVYNALDVICLPSLSEGFPNVVGEAMACGRHCVVTDVGDCKYLVGDAGIVVRPNDPQALAEGLRQALAAGGWNEHGRRRILEHFTVERLVDRTEKTLREYCLRGQSIDLEPATPEVTG